LPQLLSIKSARSFIVDLDKIFQILVGNIEDNVSILDYAELLVTLSLNHFYDLLGHIYKYMSAQPDAAKAFSEMEQKLTKSIVSFRSYLYHPPKFARKLEDDFPKELQALSQMMKVMWKNWLNMTESDVVKQAIESNCIPMAHSYFVIVKRMLQKNVKAHFGTVANDWVLELLQQGELTKAQKVFTNLVSHFIGLPVVVSIINYFNFRASPHWKQ